MKIGSMRTIKRLANTTTRKIKFFLTKTIKSDFPQTMLQVDRNRIEIGTIQKMTDVLNQFLSKFKGVKTFQMLKTNELTCNS